MSFGQKLCKKIWPFLAKREQVKVKCFQIQPIARGFSLQSIGLDKKKWENINIHFPVRFSFISGQCERGLFKLDWGRWKRAHVGFFSEVNFFSKCLFTSVKTKTSGTLTSWLLWFYRFILPFVCFQFSSVMVTIVARSKFGFSFCEVCLTLQAIIVLHQYNSVTWTLQVHNSAGFLSS